MHENEYVEQLIFSMEDIVWTVKKDILLSLYEEQNMNMSPSIVLLELLFCFCSQAISGFAWTCSLLHINRSEQLITCLSIRILAIFSQ